MQLDPHISALIRKRSKKERHEHSGAVQPCGDADVKRQARCLTSESGKDVLGDFLGECGVDDSPARGAVYEARVADCQVSECGFIAVVGPELEEVLVGAFAHRSLTSIAGPT